MPTNRPRPDPKIPDHEVLRRFGGGAYGEVWLARGVTGALRAVKVLWREDFEDERSFEREFEGILKYEPISRDHPGLVNVLHVGRSPDGNEFYYYVMELGDDITAGRDINPIEYEARTLRSDIKREEGRRLETEACIDVGQRLAEGLKHLHDNGLAHRDVKPANVIFVNGKAKLADIGLVAARGQRTFVGTEGFVPPEGPGSAQADVYSLGKVLYEMATGRDRMDFPELPDELPTGPERKAWLALNQIICEVCEPHVSRRTISTAGDLSEALGKLKAGKRRRKRRPVGAILTSMFLGMVLVWGGWEVLSESPWGKAMVAPPEAPPVVQKQAYIRVVSTPEDAEVLDISEDRENGKPIGSTPTDVLPAFVGEKIRLRIIQDGYQPYELTTVVPPEAAEEPFLIRADLEIFAPPTMNEPWSDQLGRDYRPLGEDHESVIYVTAPAWEKYLESEERPEGLAQVLEVVESGRKLRVILTSVGEATNYCNWLVRTGIEKGFLTEDHEAMPLFEDKFDKPGISEVGRREGWRPFKVLVRRIPYGTVLVSSEPPGAEIYFDGVKRGLAEGPLLVDMIRPGTWKVTASMEGYKSETREITVGPKQAETLVLSLEQDTSVILDRPWENSLGMKFVPVGDEWMAAVWETRRKDYRAYAESVGTQMPLVADGVESDEIEDPNEDHPVTFISRDDAEAFCEWLTAKERGEDRMKRSLEYRLPTDAEWSALAGRQEEEGYSPARRDLLKPGEFFWGGSWPPPEGVGNLAGEESELSLGSRIEGYDDGFGTTSPVGSFAANELGIYDLCGNAQEWVMEPYSSLSLPDGEGVLRGGGWLSHQEKDLYIGSRNPQPPTASEGTYGFRIVIARERIVEDDLTEEVLDEIEEPSEDDGRDPD
ncbi:SUMF1/EgtB/PvdO family nonheme iron enzyme [Haloferula sp.]|uniref:SUMF1/EgtB/PvdO family nonheme iron enzyme n=1 Tax=Haloferula sp. TaxID=2497595 RepID=UPI003C7398DB